MSAAVGKWKTAEHRGMPPSLALSNGYTEMSCKCCRAAFLYWWVATQKWVFAAIFPSSSFFLLLNLDRNFIIGLQLRTTAVELYEIRGLGDWGRGASEARLGD